MEELIKLSVCLFRRTVRISNLETSYTHEVNDI